MFSQTEWSAAAFEKTVKNEQVRYEEAIVSGHGEAPKKPHHAGKGHHHDQSLEFITDSYGVASALEQVFGVKFEAAQPAVVADAPENEGLTPSVQAEIRA
jgi:hypothetical protein